MYHKGSVPKIKNSYNLIIKRQTTQSKNAQRNRHFSNKDVQKTYVATTRPISLPPKKKKKQNLFPDKILYTEVHSSIIYNEF